MVELCFCICFHELERHLCFMRLCLACEFWLYCFMTERRCFVACCKIINRFVLLLHSLDLSAGVLRIHISLQQVIPLQVCFFFFISFFATLNPNPLLCFLCDVCRHEVVVGWVFPFHSHAYFLLRCCCCSSRCARCLNGI